jgi:hypothetical protein
VSRSRKPGARRRFRSQALGTWRGFRFQELGTRPWFRPQEPGPSSVLRNAEPSAGSVSRNPKPGPGSISRNPKQGPGSVPENLRIHSALLQHERKNISKHSNVFKNTQKRLSSDFPVSWERNPKERRILTPLAGRKRDLVLNFQKLEGLESF